MSALANIQERLQDTARMIAELDREIVRYPDVAALRTNIRSLEKVKKRLEEELLSEAGAMGREVCRYRILPEQGRAKLADLAAALGHYQSVVSVFYEAGRKARGGLRGLAKKQQPGPRSTLATLSPGRSASFSPSLTDAISSTNRSWRIR